SWKILLNEYKEGNISVGCFSARVFAMIKADKQTLLKFVKNKVKIRAGFQQLINYCHKKNFKFVIVSNGLDLYIEAILAHLGINDIDIMAAKTRFTDQGIDARYIGPDGKQMDDGFKEAYSRLFLKKGYRLIYVGDGHSDISAAQLAHHVFASEELLDYCKKAQLSYTPFKTLNDVTRGLERFS
ncbi:MAG: HAD-IB family phosphatase, partial [Dehalococcoidales bacterium]|nr:HAD-IB family phosphatase [Dehalococcoidales bacterium]